MQEILIVKTAALGDVLRTTSILEGLHERHPKARITWVTAPGAVDLVRTHPFVYEVVALDTRSSAALEAVARKLAPVRWARGPAAPSCERGMPITTSSVSRSFTTAAMAATTTGISRASIRGSGTTIVPVQSVAASPVRASP